MATLILSTVGTAIGGPVGGLIGAAIGQSVDQNILFKPKGREGPRLQELAVQTSSYGTQIPAIYGRMRVAGTVIWATDLQESKSTDGGSKGKPKTTTYSYSANLAVALSSRAAGRVGRIWADGKIFRGSAGDFKTQTGFRFYSGSESQAPDNLISAAEGAGSTPGHRGLALAVFEDMDLTEYGNRIPSLTFEIIADESPVQLGALIHDISANKIRSDTVRDITGYSASGANRRSAIEAATENFDFRFLRGTEYIHASEWSEASDADEAEHLFVTDSFGKSSNGADLPASEYRTIPGNSIAQSLSLRYYEPERDYQAGVQQAFRPGLGRIVLTRDFPAALPAESAKQVAAMKLRALYESRRSARIHILNGFSPVRPGSHISLISADGNIPVKWRVRSCELKNGVSELVLTQSASAIGFASGPADEGRSVADVDARAGKTRHVMVDLPFDITAPMDQTNTAQLYAAAAGDAGWRNADFFVPDLQGNPSRLIGKFAAPAIIGRLDEALPSAHHALLDERNIVEVDLYNETMELFDADTSQILAGVNLAAVGQEIIQFSKAERVNDTRYRLSGLLRGLGGTEADMVAHVPNEDFTLLQPADLLLVEPAQVQLFAPSEFYALGREDDVPVAAYVPFAGRSLRPWSPVHPDIHKTQSNDIVIRWTRRSRSGSQWLDHVEVGLGEDKEAYRVDITPRPFGEAFTANTAVPSFQIPSSELAQLRAQGADQLDISIRQSGTFTISPALECSVSI